MLIFRECCVLRVAEFSAMGCNVDSGMIMALDKETSHGVELIHVLACFEVATHG